MKRLSVLLLALLFVTVIGCDGDGGGTTPPPPPAPGPGPGGGDDDDDDGGPVVLDSGSKTIATGSGSGAIPVTAPGAGTIQAVVTWSVGPPQLTAFFKLSGPQNYGWVNGQSPLTSTTQASAQGQIWSFYIANTPGPQATVNYTITYTPN